LTPPLIAVARVVYSLILCNHPSIYISIYRRNISIEEEKDEEGKIYANKKKALLFIRRELCWSI